MQTFSTPMMKQYQQIKNQYPDCLLFYRMGDFYELFMEDATIGSQVLNITLTSRPKGKDGRIPMAGVPYHVVDPYLAKLVQAGYKVAICEQTSPPSKKGIIHREVVRVVTPGTVFDEKALAKKDHNYIVSLLVEGQSFALTVADVSTGYFACLEIGDQDPNLSLKEELAKLGPTECIIPTSLYNNPEILKLLKTQNNLNIYCFHQWADFSKKSESFLQQHFGVKTLEGFGVKQQPLALQTAAALLGYLQQTQKNELAHIKKISLLKQVDHLVLDRSTMINLELFSTIREHDARGSLLSVLDQTTTAMGGRLLKQWLLKPLVKDLDLISRWDSVEELISNVDQRNNLQQFLAEINDVERSLARLAVGLGNARDLVNLKSSLSQIIKTQKQLNELSSSLLQSLAQNIKITIPQVICLIEEHIIDEPPITLRDGGLIKVGINEQLDKLRLKVENSQQWLAKLEADERVRTGINSLKIRFNQVFGFYIEVSKSNLSLIPTNYQRKQTLVNGERFITPELKAHEEIILLAEEKIKQIEYQLFSEVLEKVLLRTQEIQEASQSIATVDCLINFANLAEKFQYIRPEIIYSGEINIKGGRHPVVEQLLEAGSFVPNDICLDNLEQSLLIITGPNMAGKSVLIRQVAVIVLMAQIGCFVPANRAQISLTDRIFVRSGASDVITSGLSTFMVEMVETAHILNNATEKSLIVMDEIGRGTSTYDGISIAWAVAEYLVTNFKSPPKTLFATHYHELQKLEKNHPHKIKNYHMAVDNDQGQPIFLHTLMKGGASHSFGVAVARLAGVPQPVITKALEMLQELEKRQIEEPVNLSFTSYEPDPQIIAEHLMAKELEAIDILEMTPLEALNKLAEIKNKFKLIKTENQKFLQD